VVTDFPWPITDEELLLNEALTSVMSTCDARGGHEESHVRQAAANLIVEAYNQGIRDADVLAHYALKALRPGDRKDSAPPTPNRA
jgi:hypothetical protein